MVYLDPHTPLNITFRSKGVPLWEHVLYALITDPQTWLENYHDRSISETGNSMSKLREPTRIRKKLSERKCMEESLKFNIHNIRQIRYLWYLALHLLRLEVLAS
jgi:transposase